MRWGDARVLGRKSPKTNLQHVMFILTADQCLTTPTGCVWSTKGSFVFWIMCHSQQVIKLSLWMNSVLTQVVMSCTQSAHLSQTDCLPCSSGHSLQHLTLCDISLQQWKETHNTRSFTVLDPSPGQRHDAGALMGKPDAHKDKHTHTYQTYICTYNRDIHHSYSPVGRCRRTEFSDNL